MKVTKVKLKKMLQKDALTVVFTKKDGTERIMNCTLQESHLPTVEKNEDSRKENKDVLSVWDLDVNDWRSFRLDSIKKYTISDQWQFNFNK